MAVVIDLDPARRASGRSKASARPSSSRLRGAFRHAPGQAFAGVAQGVFHQLGLFAALGHAQHHLAPGLFRQRLGIRSISSIPCDSRIMRGGTLPS
jgi:hypothetical protein